MNTVEKIILVLLIIIMVGGSFIAVRIVGFDKIKARIGGPEEDSSDLELVGDDAGSTYEGEAFDIGVNELVSKEGFCEFSFDKHNFALRVDPPNPGRVNTYYEIKDEGNIYLDIPVNIKSLLKEARMADQFISARLLFNGEYEYNPFMIIEEYGGSRFTYPDITPIEPLKTHRLHFLVELPKDVEESERPLDLLIEVDGNHYKLNLR